MTDKIMLCPGYEATLDEIDAELAYRDSEIERLRVENERLSERIHFSDSQVSAVVRAFWRRVQPYVYAENQAPYPKELGAEIPVEFQAHMGTALLALWLCRKPLEQEL